MKQVLIDHPRLFAEKEHGTEGPAHDPYGFVEYRVWTPEKGWTELHEGLGTWIRYRNELLDTPHGESYVRKYMFPSLTGYSVEQLERIHRKLSSQCRYCGFKHLETVAGYPGEQFTICLRCRNVVDSYFCESEIE